MLNKIYKYVSIIVIVVLMGVVGWSQYQLNNSYDDVTSWQNRYAEIELVHKVDSTSYAKQALIVNKLKSDNEELNDVVDARDAELAATVSANLALNLQIDALETEAYIDTAHGDDSGVPWIGTPNPTPNGISSRKFTYNKQGILMNGYFNIESPYLFYLSNFSMDAKIDIGLIYNEDNVWEYIITTNSKYITVSDVTAKVLSDFTSSNVKNFGYLVGLGYHFNNEFNAVSVAGGIYYKQFDFKLGTVMNGIPNAHIEVLYRGL